MSVLRLPAGLQWTDLIGLREDLIPHLHPEWENIQPVQCKNLLARADAECRLPPAMMVPRQTARDHHLRNAKRARTAQFGATRKSPCPISRPSGQWTPPSFPIQPTPANAPSNRDITRAFSIIQQIRAAGAGALRSIDGLVAAIRILNRVTPDMMANRWPEERPELPRQRAAFLSHCAAVNRKRTIRAVQEDAIFLELSAWVHSAKGYVSALKLWYDTCKILRTPVGVPCKATVGAFCTEFRNGKSLEQYLSRVRTILTFLDFEWLALSPEKCKGFVAGCNKRTRPEVKRTLHGATGKQTRDLVKWLHRQGARYRQYSDAFVVARQFALRFGSECVDMCLDAPNNFVTLSPSTACVTCIRKGNTIPEHIYRECICAEQCPSLCGVCALHRLNQAREGCGQVFPAVRYTEALRVIREGAAALLWPDPMGWGTHCWRRGWGREAFEAGGLCGLFQSGGWRGVAALGYLEARQRSGLAACTFALEFSESEGED